MAEEAKEMNPEQRQVYTQHFELDKLPPHMRDGVSRYLFDGIPPGGFLTAVLENDLVGAYGKLADF